MKRKVIAIVEARMTSSRLPGKHLLPVLEQPIIGHLIHRLKAVKLINEILVAMTARREDDLLEAYVKSIGGLTFRGSEDDVMGRILGAAKKFEADVICEVTGDCPIIDINLILQAIETFLSNNVEYVNNGKLGLPDGMGCQVFSTKTLEHSSQMTVKPLDREHVTLHIKRHPELFSAIYIPPLKNYYWPELAVTLDEHADFKLIKLIIEHFGKEKSFSDCLEVIDFLRLNPKLLEINKTVFRKGAT